MMLCLRGLYGIRRGERKAIYLRTKTCLYRLQEGDNLPSGAAFAGNGITVGPLQPAGYAMSMASYLASSASAQLGHSSRP